MSVKYRSIKGTSALIDEEQLKKTSEAWQSGNAGAGGWSFNLKYQTKTGLTESGAGNASPSGGTTGQYAGVVSPDYSEGIVAPAGRPLVLANVLRNEETSSNLVRLVRGNEDAPDGSAQTTEGAAYGETDESVTPHDWKLVDTTTVFPVTEDFLMDVPSALSYITKRVGYLVQRAEETSLVSGNGTSPNMLGLLSAADGGGGESATTDSVTPNGTSAFLNTAIAKLISDTYTASGCAPEWILMNSATWLQYATEMVTGGSEYLSGHANEPGPRTLWNLPVVWSNAVPTTNVILGSSAGMGRWVHTSGIKVDVSPNYSTYYGSGLVAVRAKLRSCLAYEHPSAVGVLTIA